MLQGGERRGESRKRRKVRTFGNAYGELFSAHAQLQDQSAHYSMSRETRGNSEKGEKG